MSMKLADVLKSCSCQRIIEENGPDLIACMHACKWPAKVGKTIKHVIFLLCLLYLLVLNANRAIWGTWL